MAHSALQGVEERFANRHGSGEGGDPADILVVDDTPVGIAAGKNAGCVTVAISKTGNALGLTEREVTALDPSELNHRLQEIEQDFLAKGADHVIQSVADLPELLARIHQ